jgi:hypothetical protein
MIYRATKETTVRVVGGHVAAVKAGDLAEFAEAPGEGWEVITSDSIGNTRKLWGDVRPDRKRGNDNQDGV